MTNQLLVEAKELNRYFSNYHAVDNINLILSKGEVLGLLGPNGAGKSTTMQMLSGNLSPASGSIEINGINLLDNPIEAKNCIGYLPENPPIYRDMKVLEYINFCAKINKIKKNKCKESIDIALQRCGLDQVSHRLIGNLSKGYQQRVGIAQAILHAPAVIILDEPTVGLDPIQIKEIRQLIRDLAKDHSVILSSHILPEIKAVSDRVQIINQGKTVFADTLDNLSSHANKQYIQLKLVTRNDEQTLQLLTNLISVSKVKQIKKGYFHLFGEVLENITHDVCHLVVSEEWKLLDMSRKQSSLESLFIDLIYKEKEVA